MPFHKKIFRKANAHQYPNKPEAIQWSGPNYIIGFPDKNHPFIPYYHMEGQTEEWIEAPFNGYLYYDPIEDCTEFKSIAETVDKLVKEEMGDNRLMGSCHMAWAIKKRILKERYGIEWHSVSDLNPNCTFD